MNREANRKKLSNQALAGWHQQDRAMLLTRLFQAFPGLHSLCAMPVAQREVLLRTASPDNSKPSHPRSSVLTTETAKTSMVEAWGDRNNQLKVICSPIHESLLVPFILWLLSPKASLDQQFHRQQESQVQQWPPWHSEFALVQNIL